MKQVLIDVQNRLTTLAILKYVDEDWGQLDFYSPNFPVKWPAALIDITSGTFSNVGKHVQQGVISVNIRVANLKITNSSGMAPQTQKNKAFEIFDIAKAVHVALHGWSGSNQYSALIRTNVKKMKRSDGVQVFDVTYTTQIVDNSTEQVAPLTFKRPGD